ncbi:hypothetical protein L9F63_010021 [Diploptera punctata]|uniref:Gustatory receptor n=1 Tax=Diploptera punctata TaxID=6984 RepID=A0AAD8ERM1_DIPPU|nr:hypothetical protein L9F63_010021 [Diploptera punctata]
MIKFKSNDVHSAVMPLYYVSRLLGLASYRYEKHTSKPSASSKSRNDISQYPEREFRTSKCGIIYTTIILLALFVGIVYYLVHKILYDFTEVKITYVVTQVMTLCLSTATTLVSLGLELTLNRKRMEKVMLKFTQIDRILNLESNSIYRRIRCFVILELVLSLILLGARHGYELWSRGERHYITVSMRFIVHFMSTVMIVQFVSFIQVLKQRYCCVNESLAVLGDIDDKLLNFEQGRVSFTEHKLGISSSNSTSIVPHAEEIPNSESHPHNSSIFTSESEIGHISTNVSSKFISHRHPQGVTNIHALRYVHTLLYDIGDLINSIYGIQILLAMAYIFMSVVKYFHVVMISNVGTINEEISSFKVNGIIPLVCVVSIHVANLLWLQLNCNCFHSSYCILSCSFTAFGFFNWILRFFTDL